MHTRMPGMYDGASCSRKMLPEIIPPIAPPKVIIAVHIERLDCPTMKTSVRCSHLKIESANQCWNADKRIVLVHCQ